MTEKAEQADNPFTSSGFQLGPGDVDVSEASRTECPEESEEYTEFQEKAFGNPAMRNEDHDVRTWSQPNVVDGEPVLVVGASCSCGWEETRYLRGEEE